MFRSQVFPVYYIAKNHKTCLSNVQLLVRKPDYSIEGLFAMTEFDPVNHKGIYTYDYSPVDLGTYLFSVFENSTWKYSAHEICEDIPVAVSPIMEFN